MKKIIAVSDKIKRLLVAMKYKTICNNLFRILYFILRRKYSKQFSDKDGTFILLFTATMAKKIINRELSREEAEFFNGHTDIYEKERANLANIKEIESIESEYAYLNSDNRPIERDLVDRIEFQTEARLKKEINETVLDNIEKIDFTTNNISAFFQIFVSIFVITGFFYNYYYLGYFGIDVSPYFTIGDYLSASIGKIYVALFTVALMLLSVLMYSFRSGYIVDLKLDYTGIVRVRIREFMNGISLIAVVIVITFYNYLELLLGKASVMCGFVIILISTVYFHWPIERIFKKPLNIDFWFIGLVYFSLIMISIISAEINYVEKVDIAKTRDYSITYDKDFKNTNPSWILLTGNSGYMFFYDKNKKKSYAISRNVIKSVEMKAD